MIFVNQTIKYDDLCVCRTRIKYKIEWLQDLLIEAKFNFGYNGRIDLLGTISQALGQSYVLTVEEYINYTSYLEERIDELQEMYNSVKDITKDNFDQKKLDKRVRLLFDYLMEE